MDKEQLPLNHHVFNENTPQPKANESGRSMVEMLGVLTLMGILSVGGVMGYRWAMDKYEANEILNEVRKRAVVTSQQRLQGIEINLKEFYPVAQFDAIKGIYPVAVTDNCQGDPSFFMISVSSIATSICNHLLAQAEQMPWVTGVLLNQMRVSENTECPENKNSEISFAFGNTLNDGQDLPPEEVCVPECVNELPICRNGSCISCLSDDDCLNNPSFGKGFICSSTMCVQPEPDSCSQCTNNQYCHYNSYTDHCSKLGGSEGVCRDKPPKSALTKIIGRSNGRTYYISPEGNLNWWSAKSFCDSYGMHLAGLWEACPDWNGQESGSNPPANACLNLAGTGNCTVYLNSDNNRGNRCFEYGVSLKNGGVDNYRWRYPTNNDYALCAE